MADLPVDPNTFFCYYNGFEFPVETSPVMIDTQPVYDAAGRTVIHTVLTFSLESYIAVHAADDTDNTDERMSAIRQMLTAPAGEFVLQGAGFGDLHVNAPGEGGDRDVIWGPKPRMLSERYLGGRRCWKINWRVEVAVLDQCFTNKAFSGRAMEFNYSVTQTISTTGLSTISYNGHLRIPQTRASEQDRTLSDNADLYREKIVPPLLPLFRRADRSFVLSEDKCTLNFTITDSELPSWSPPPHAHDVKISHTVRSNNVGLSQWSHQITGQYSVVKGQKKESAWLHFGKYVKMAVDEMRKGTTRRCMVMPADLVISEPDVYGTQTGTFAIGLVQTFSLTDAERTLLSGQGGATFEARRPLLENVFASLALWRMPPDGDKWLDWQQSMSGPGTASTVWGKGNNAWTARGLSQWGFQNTQDSIIDPCLPIEEQALADAPPAEVDEPDPGGEDRLPGTNVTIFPGFGLPPLTLPQEITPTPEGSWFAYDNFVSAYQSNDRLMHKPLPTRYNQLTPDADETSIHDVSGYYYAAYSAAPDHVIQDRAAPSNGIILSGSAIRVGYEITPPRLTSYKGIPVVEAPAGQTFVTKSWAILGGQVLVAARWAIPYWFTKLPTRPISTPSTPITLGLDKPLGKPPESDLSTPVVTTGEGGGGGLSTPVIGPG